MTEDEFNRIARFIENRCGIELQQKRALVEGRLIPYLNKNGYSSVAAYINTVEGNPSGKEVQNLINLLTTNHTYFMREPEHFDFYKNVVLPNLKEQEKKSKNLFIWCGASSTGEEPYTLAMITHDFFGFEKKEWDSQILATDICTEVLQTAARGVYTGNQIHAIPERWKHMYFKQIGDDEFQVTQEIKDDVIYRKLNLMSPFPFKRPLHVVFLRNVMIYFDKATKLELLSRVADAMAPGGYLFIGTTEGIDRKDTSLSFIKPSVYQKRR